jgi:hypothetical protein
MTAPSEEKLPEFHAAILTADGEFATESFHTAQELAARLRELVDRDVSVSCFHGARLPISKPPYRYLMTKDANLPLWAAPETIEPDDTGYLGVDPVHLEGPPQIQVAEVRTSPPQDDEFFSDQTSEIHNIFDDALPDPDA